MRHAAPSLEATAFVDAPWDVLYWAEEAADAAAGGRAQAPCGFEIDAGDLGWAAKRWYVDASPGQGVHRRGDTGWLGVEAFTSHEGRCVIPLHQFGAAPCQHPEAAAVLEDVFVLDMSVRTHVDGAWTSRGMAQVIAEACLRLVGREAVALRDFVVRRHLARGIVPGGTDGGRPVAGGMREAAELLHGRGYGRSQLVCCAPAGLPPPPPGGGGEGGGIIHIASSAMGGRKRGVGIVFDPDAAFAMHAKPTILLESPDSAGGGIARLTHAVLASVNVDAIVPVWLS